MSSPASTHSTTSSAAQASSSAAQVALPTSQLLLQAAKLAIEEDRAIMMDYYHPTMNGTAFLGEDGETKDRILLKSKEEFTSIVKKMYKVGDDYIVATENSLYVISGKTQKRRVNIAAIQEAYDS